VRPERSANISQQLPSELRALELRGELRTLPHLSGVNLCSNDYLGLSTDSRLKEALALSVAESRQVGSTGSRLLSGNAPEWETLEEEFASFAETDSALYFSSGYSANIGLLGAILGPHDIAFSDSLNHASLIDGIRLSGADREIYPHADLDILESALRQREKTHARKVIVTESVFSMDGDRAPLEELAELAERYGAELIVDEAHATGVHGREGRGLVAAHGLTRQVLAIVHTCGKALASMGAFVCGGRSLKQFLLNRSRTFLFSTAMPPYFAGQIRAALHLAMAAESKRTCLLANSVWFAAGLRSAGFDTGPSSSQIVPVVLRDNHAALYIAEQLQRDGFGVRAIRPPTVPPKGARLRLSLTCQITRADLERLRDSLVTARMTIAAGVAAGRR
jgi:8-amino-7-oxononanoate synthase